MIIKYLSRVSKSPKPYSFFGKISPREELVQTKMADVPVKRIKPGAIISQTSIKSYPELTLEQKKELKLFIPTSPFNDRLSIVKQMQYLTTITSSLYELQKSLLQPQIRILQSNIDSNLNKYLNLVYKDIYARYLVSKGIGIDWEGRYPYLGVMNPKQSFAKTSPYELFIKALEQGKLFVSKVPTLFSLKTGNEFNIDDCEVQIIKKIGYYVLFPIVGFGAYNQQFEPILRRGGNIHMLGLVNDLWKSTQSQALTLIEKMKYIILKKAKSDDYLVTSLEHYESSRNFFMKNQYSKHSIVDSQHFEGMVALNSFDNKIPVIFETFKRGIGSEIHVLCPSHTAADNDIVADYGINIASTVSEQGVLKIDDKQISLDDPSLEQNTREFLRNKGRILEGINQVIEDTLVMSKEKEVLHLILIQKLFIRVTEQERNNLLNDLRNNCSIEESKIVIPRHNRDEPLKGRNRRAFVKRQDAARKQQTDYYTLEQSVKLTKLCISTINQKQYPTMVNLKKGRVVASQNNIRKMRQMNQTNSINIETIKTVKESFSQQKVFYLDENFIKSAQILDQDNNNIKPVAIEPQSATEGLMQYYLHLSAALSLPFRISMIKLHPTLKDTEQNLEMQNLIMGATKSNDMRQYGWGYEAVRVWVAKMDCHKGDRIISQSEVNKQQPNIAYIRKAFWRVLSIINKISPEKLNEIRKSTPQLPWFDQFMMDHISYYIMHMQKAYKRLDISSAYELTLQFFKDYLEEIYIKSIRKQLISYYKEDSKMLVLQRILHLVSVISPIMPFTAYHVSKIQMNQWPKVNQVQFQKIDLYNKLIMLRIVIRNKLEINKIKNSTVYIGGINNIPEDQMALFLGVNQVVYTDPNLIQRFAIKQGDFLVRVYDYETCYRCDPQIGNKKFICRLCTSYLS